jgi:hypothetical protein
MKPIRTNKASKAPTLEASSTLQTEKDIPMTDVTSTEPAKRGRKPRDPNAPKQDRKPRPLAVFFTAKVNENTGKVEIENFKISRDAMSLVEMFTSASAAEGTPYLKRVEID